MHKLILTLLLFISISASAQPPGFQGKRLSVNYNLSFFPFSGYLFEDNLAEQNEKHQLGVEYVVSRNGSIGLGVEVLNSYVYLPKVRVSNVVFNGQDTMLSHEEIKSQANFYGATFLFKYKVYSFDKKGAIAPLGRYTIIEAGYSMFNLSDDGRFIGGKTRTPINLDYSSIIFGVGAGQQSIFMGRFIFDLNVKFSLTGSLISLVSAGSASGEEDASGKNFNEINARANLKHVISYLMNINIGVGYLFNGKKQK